MPRLDGYDAAHYQYDHGEVDFAAGLLAGLFWIAWKATQSIRYVDPTFAKARSRWLGYRMRGMYHWLSSTTDVDAQAAHYLDTIGIWSVGEFAMLDAEERGITAAMCLRWCELVEAVTHRPAVIYTGLYVAGGSIWKSDALRMSKYGPRPFIVAAYVTEANLTARMVQTGALPKYPRDAWQFSSNGPVPGVAGRCDMDQVDNVAAFELACEISHIVPQPPGDDMATAFLIVTDLPGQYMWTPGTEPIPFTNPADRDELLKALGIDPASGGTISKEMFERLSPKPAPATAVGGPLHIEATLVGTAIPGGG